MFLDLSIIKFRRKNKIEGSMLSSFINRNKTDNRNILYCTYSISTWNFQKPKCSWHT